MMPPAHVHRGIDLRQALELALLLGCLVWKPRRTGEVVVAHRLLDRRVRCNGRRKDAPLALVAFLREISGTVTRTDVSRPQNTLSF